MDFSEACKEQLTKQQAKRVRDYRMDYDLRLGCKADVPKVRVPSFFFCPVRLQRCSNLKLFRVLGECMRCFENGLCTSRSASLEILAQVCQGEINEEDKETGAVLKCLVKNSDAVSDTCSHEISRSLRAAFQFYQPVSSRKKQAPG